MALVVVGLEGERLVGGAWALRGGEVVRRATIDEELAVKEQDVSAVVRRVASRVRGAGGRGVGVVLVVPRHRLVQHRVTVAGAEGLSEAELASAARLQLERRAAMELASSALGVRRVTGDLCVVTILTGDDASWARALAEAMRCPGLVVTARSLAAVGMEQEGVVIDASAAEAEAAVLHEGMIVATASLGPVATSEEGQGNASWGTELRRLWLAARAETRVDRPSRVVLIAPEEWMGRLAPEVETALRQEVVREGGAEALWRSLEAIARDRLGSQPRIAVVPMGRAREPVGKGVRLGGLAAGLLLVVAMGGYLAAQRHLSTFRVRAGLASEERAELAELYIAQLRADARLNHAQRWAGSDPDWLEALEAVTGVVPAGQARLGEVSGRAEGVVGFEAMEGRYPGGTWTVRAPMQLSLDAKTRQRSVGEALRAAILSDGLFSVETRGPDVDEGIELLLKRDVAEPAKGDKP